MIEQAPLAHLCPICGESNSCQQVKQSSKQNEDCMPEACWCLSVKLDAQSRQKLNAQTNGKRCLCQSCIQKIAQAQQ
tara:strand:- start:5494 stop:5724 length:231 start_codon:yes stop_codon:yes gene_type:complete